MVKMAKKKRKNGKVKIPLEIAVTALTLPFTSASSGWASPIQCFTSNDWDGVSLNVTRGFLGFTPGEIPNIMQIINPFNFEYARYTKMLIFAGLISKIRKRFVKLDKMPIIKSWVS